MTTYHLARDGQQLGCHTDNEIRRGLAAGTFLLSDLCWTAGMGAWEPLRFHFTAAADTPSQALQPPDLDNPYAAPQVLGDMYLPLLQTGRLATHGQRFGAALLDGMVAMLAFGIPVGIGFLAVGSTGVQGDLPMPISLGLGIGGLAFIGLLIWNLVWLSTRGQTIGKRMMKIHIATFPDSQPAGFVKAVLLRVIVNGLIGFVPLLGAIYGLVDILFIFSADRRCLHDLIAGTHVVQDS